jgi:hypothetical protein
MDVDISTVTGQPGRSRTDTHVRGASGSHSSLADLKRRKHTLRVGNKAEDAANMRNLLLRVHLHR